MRVTNTYTAPIGLPGQSKALGGVELDVGANDVDDAVWAKSKESPQIVKMMDLGLLIEEGTPSKKTGK